MSHHGLTTFLLYDSVVSYSEVDENQSIITIYAEFTDLCKFNLFKFCYAKLTTWKWDFMKINLKKLRNNTFICI